MKIRETLFTFNLYRKFKAPILVCVILYCTVVVFLGYIETKIDLSW